MKRFLWMVIATSLAACCPMGLSAQSAAKAATSVPRLVQFSGTLTGSSGRPLAGLLGVTFSLYEDEQGGAPIWMETQNVQADAIGRYTVLLGSTSNEGIPAEAFSGGQGRWLQVQTQGASERPRTLLVSVPYALKAVDAETLGGLPASAYALAATPAGGLVTQTAAAASVLPAAAAPTGPWAKDALKPATITGSGTAGAVPLWTGSSSLGNSEISQTSGGNVGIGATSSVTKFVVETSEAFGIGGGTTNTSGIAIQGQAQAASGSTVGVSGTAASTSGIGVQGVADADSGSTYGVAGTSASTDGVGVRGRANATSGEAWGVYGISASSSGVGTAGQATASSGTTYGVEGTAASTSGVGVAGYTGTGFSSIGGALEGTPAGVWGDSGTNGTQGVLATAGTSEALAAYNSSTNVATMFVENQTTNTNAIVFATFSGTGGFCDAFVNGNLTCSGSVGGHAVLSNSHDVALYGVQAADNWMEDFGSGQLHNGAAVVTLDAEYAQTVNTGMDYHVFLTPNGDCKGLYVTQKLPTSFEVHELGGGASSIAFDYRITARRKGMEDVRLEDLTNKIQRDTRPKSAGGQRATQPARTAKTAPPAPANIR